MSTLSIDKTVFSYVRSFLVVIVAILIVLVIDDATGHEHEVTPAQVMQVAQRRSPRTRVTEATASPESVARTESYSPRKEAAASPQETGYIAVDDGSTVAVANGQGATMIATGSHRDRIKQAMLQARQRGEEATYNEIAKIAGVGYSTVKKHAPAIKMEIAASTFISTDEE